MRREFERSAQTNQLFDLITKTHRIGIILEIPGMGQVRLRGDAAREFMWTLRSHKALKLMDRWIQNVKVLRSAARDEDASSVGA